MRPFLILLCLLVVSLDAVAQNWFQTVGPVEDNVHDLCIDSNGILYAVTPLGVNRSTNGGGHWTRPFIFPDTSAQAKHIIVAPNGNIIASSVSGIYLSTDNGSTFTNRFAARDRTASINFATTGSGRIYAGYWNWLLYSDNNGEDWQNYQGWDDEIYVIGLAASHDTVITSGGSFFLRYSTDNGLTWKGRPGISQAPLKLLIHPNGMWIWAEHQRGLYRRTLEEDWLPITGWVNASVVYTADCFSNGSIFVSSSMGIHLVRDTSLWVNVSSGFGRDTSNKYYPVSRFIEDPKAKIYYAATKGAGVWKSRTMLNVNHEHAPASFQVTPNPARELVTIEYTTPTPKPVTIKLYDILGRTLWERMETAVPGQNSFSFDAHSLLPGSYLIVLELAGEVKTRWVTIL